MDLFSLDIEGAEEAVLLTIPWHRVDIDILLIEVEYRPVLMFLSFSHFLVRLLILTRQSFQQLWRRLDMNSYGQLGRILFIGK